MSVKLGGVSTLRPKATKLLDPHPLDMFWAASLMVEDNNTKKQQQQDLVDIDVYLNPIGV